MDKANDVVLSQSPPSYEEDEIDIRELLFLLWKGRWILVVSSLLATLLSVYVAIKQPDIYRAEALLAPVSAEESGALSGLASQYGGLASLAGINVGSLNGGVNKTELGIEVLQSRQFLGEFIYRHELLVPLMAANDWKSATNELEFDAAIYDFETEEWVREPNPPRKSLPSLLEASQQFREIMSISQNSDTGFVSVSIEHYSPYIAKQWVDWLVEDINSEMKSQDVLEAEKSIRYVQDQLSATRLSELRTIFYQLIEEQTKTIMLANARPEYIFQTIDPAIVAETSVRPKRVVICFIGIILGLFCGVLLVFVRHFLTVMSKPVR